MIVRLSSPADARMGPYIGCAQVTAQTGPSCLRSSSCIWFVSTSQMRTQSADPVASRLPKWSKLIVLIGPTLSPIIPCAMIAARLDRHTHGVSRRSVADHADVDGRRVLERAWQVA
mmetsp:Transcript_16898/g.45798  ORF Transcript_16898/g.45798 Transcript_16898/m.45798 type:complete len:116 (-) Transcript_16898:2-349(-)